MSITDEFDHWNPLEEDYRKYNSHGGIQQASSTDHKPFLYVGKIPREFDEQSFHQFFCQFGNVKRVRINQTENDFLYGFVNFNSVEEAEKAFIQLKHVDTFGMIIRMGVGQLEKTQDMKRAFFHGPRQHPLSDFKEKVPLKITANVDHEFSERLVSEAAPGFSNEEELDEYFNHEYESPYSRDCRRMPEVYEINGNMELPLKCLNDHANSTFRGPGHITPSVISDQMSIVPWQQGNMAVNSCTSYMNCCRPVHTHCCCHTSVNSFCSSRNATCCSNSGRLYDPNIPALKANFPLCTNCRQQPGTFECTNCTEPYCSRTCQEAHWPYHKVVCRLRKIAHEGPLAHNETVNQENIIANHRNHYENVYSNLEGSAVLENQSVAKSSRSGSVSKNIFEANDSASMDFNKNQNFGPHKKGLLDTPEMSPNCQSKNISKDVNKTSDSEAYDSSENNNQNFNHRNERLSDIPPSTKSKIFKDHQSEKSYNHENLSLNNSKSKSVSNHLQKDNKKSYTSTIPRDSQSGRENAKSYNQGLQNNYAQKTSKYSGTDNSTTTKPPYSSQRVLPKTSLKRFQNCDTQQNFSGKQSFNRKKRIDYDPKSVTNNAKSEENWENVNSEVSASVSPPATSNQAIKSVPKQSLPDEPNSHILVSVCYIKSPAEFWVHRLNDNETIEKIAVTMMELEKSKTIFTSPTVGDLCGALFVEDNNYYRAQIMQVFENDTVDVYFIDYGNCAKIKNSNLCFLSSNLGTYPAMAIRCKLANIKPKNGSVQWPKEATDIFIKLVAEKALDVNVVEKQDSSYLVDLTNQGISVIQMLIKENLADLLSQNNVKTNSTPNETDDEIVKRPNSESPEPYIPTLLEKLKIGEKYEANIMFCDDSKIWAWIDIDDVFQKFLAMSNKLADADTKDVKISIEEGDFAIAFSPTDKMWYRSVVTKRQKDSFRVQYIDYGNEEDVTQIKEILPEHIKVCSPLLCFQAFSEEELQKFKDFITAEKFSVTVKAFVELGFEMEASALNKTVNVVAFPLFNELKSLVLTTQDSNEDVNPPKIIDSCSPSTVAPIPIKVNKINEVLMERELQANMKTPVAVSWVRSVKEIYVQRIDDMNELNELKVNIDKFCESKKFLEFTPMEGELVCARYFEDNSWYRSLVMKVLPDKKLLVLFIDYGNEEVITLNDIRRLDDLFLQPLFTISVSLYDAPPSVTDEELKKKLLDRIFDLQVVDAKSSPKQVILHENGVRIFGNAKEQLKTTSPYEIITAIQKPPLKIETQKKSALEVSLASFDGAMVTISNVDSLKHFYIRLVSRENALESMQRDMELFWKKNSSVEYYAEVDDVVCVRWKNMVVRGYILEVQGESCIVKLIDHHSTIEVVVIDIFPLPSKYFLPVFMISVKLDGVPDVKLTDNVCGKLMESSYKLKLLNQKEEPFICKLYSGDNCINEEFIDKPIKSNEKFVHVNDLEKRSLPMKEKIQAIFYHNEKQFHFLQLIRDAELIAKVTEDLKICQTLPPLVDLPCVGQVVCAKFSVDNAWYRACIEKVNNIQKKCFVTFIDFGNGEEVPMHDLRNIPDGLLSIPIVCLRVTVTNPKLVSLYEIITIEASGTEKDPVVNIIVSSQNDIEKAESSVAAVEATSSSIADSNVNITSKKECSLEFTLDNVTYVELAEGKVEIIVYFAEEGHVFCAPNIEENVKANIELVEEMTIFIQNSALDCHKTPTVGEIVMAKFADDGKWYRSAVLDICQSSAIVLFLDYGNTQETQFEDLRKMDRKFMCLPIQAILCELKGFVCKDHQRLTQIITTEGFLYSSLEAIHSLENDQHIIEIPALTQKLKELNLI